MKNIHTIVDPSSDSSIGQFDSQLNKTPFVNNIGKPKQTRISKTLDPNALDIAASESPFLTDKIERKVSGKEVAAASTVTPAIVSDKPNDLKMIRLESTR